MHDRGHVAQLVVEVVVHLLVSGLDRGAGEVLFEDFVDMVCRFSFFVVFGLSRKSRDHLLVLVVTVLECFVGVLVLDGVVLIGRCCV